MSSTPRTIIAFLLRELLSAGALSGAIRTLLDGGVGTSVRDKALDALRVAVRENLWRIVVALVAAVLLVTAAGFLVAGFFLWLWTLLGAPLAAAVTGGVFLIVGGTLLWLCARERVPPPVEQRAPPPPGAQSFMDMASAVFRDLKQGASKNALLIFALLFLAGLWLGFNDDNDDRKPEA